MTSYWKRFAPAYAGFICAGLICISGQSSVSAENGFKPVVELFTSQGCSSCPEADAFLGKLAQRDDLITLTFPVDYWDYLGWKDTLASPHFSERQRTYAAHRGDGEVYTPQIIIGGQNHFVGSNKNGVQKDLARAVSSKSSHPVLLNASLEHESIIISLKSQTEGKITDKAALWLIRGNNQKTVNIRKGENSGLTVTYSNVVQDITKIGEWSGQDLNLPLPIKDFKTGNPDFYVILLQDENCGPIRGAARVLAK